MRTMIIASLLTLAIVGPVFAAPVIRLDGTTTGTVWKVYAYDLSSENDGITAVTLKISGVTTCLNKSPVKANYVFDGSEWNLEGTYGFSDKTYAGTVTGGYEIISGISPASYPTSYATRHMGQQALSIPTHNDVGDPGTFVCPMPILIAQGGFTGTPALLAGSTPGVNVYKLGLSESYAMVGVTTDPDHPTAQMLLTGFLVPEPATIALLALGGLVALIKKRRRQ